MANVAIQAPAPVTIQPTVAAQISVFARTLTLSWPKAMEREPELCPTCGQPKKPR